MELCLRSNVDPGSLISDGSEISPGVDANVLHCPGNQVALRMENKDDYSLAADRVTFLRRSSVQNLGIFRISDPKTHFVSIQIWIQKAEGAVRTHRVGRQGVLGSAAVLERDDRPAVVLSFATQEHLLHLEVNARRVHCPFNTRLSNAHAYSYNKNTTCGCLC